MTVKEAAGLLGCSEQLIRAGLKQGVFEFGTAIKASGQWTYIITRPKFEEVTGIKTND